MAQTQQQRKKSKLDPSYACMCTPVSSVPEIEGHMGPSVLMNIPLVEFVYLAFTRMPGESYRRRLGSLLLCLCDGFRALINSLAC